MAYELRGKFWDDFNVGDVYESARRTITEADVVLFAGLSGDFNPLHTDEVFMQSHPAGRRIAHGMLTASIATGLQNQLGLFEGTTIALLEMSARWPAPVFPGDTIRIAINIKEKTETSKPERGVIAFVCQVLNQKDQVVAEMPQKVLLKRRA